MERLVLEPEVDEALRQILTPVDLQKQAGKLRKHDRGRGGDDQGQDKERGVLQIGKRFSAQRVVERLVPTVEQQLHADVDERQAESGDRQPPGNGAGRSAPEAAG